jgi:GNAT superfamily N-acetyltransferase
MEPARGGALFVVREARAEPLERAFSDDLDDPTRGLFVGDYEGAALGYGAVRTEQLRDGSVLAVITELYVEPPARQVAIGEALMASMIDWAAERGCLGVDAAALPGDRQTKNFFEGSGFTARLLVMHHRLAADR